MNHQKRRKKYRPTPAPAAPLIPPAPHLIGMTVEDYAAASGTDRLAAIRVLERAVKDGDLVRIETADKYMYARIAGGQIATTPAPAGTTGRTTP